MLIPTRFQNLKDLKRLPKKRRSHWTNHLTHLEHINKVVDFHYVETTRRYMWQSRVEIEDYSIAYFDRIAALEVPYR